MAQQWLGNLSNSMYPPSLGGFSNIFGTMGQMALSSLQSPFGKSNAPVCRCMPTDDCWPSKAQWDNFNSSLGGKLISTIPIGSVCHEGNSFGSYNPEKCAQLRADWFFPELHSNSPSSIMAPYFANQSCDPFAEDTGNCAYGTYIQYAVNATGAEDFQKTIKFVTEHNIRLTIRNTGHDYYGKTTGSGAVGIWTHHMKDISFLDYESPYHNGKAVKVGAGIQTGEVYEAAHRESLVVVGGDCDGVGWAGGYSQGGGKGLLASKYGLAPDQVLEWEVVTATGDRLVASPSSNEDLYWALSGGGGGTFGVVVSMTAKAHPDTFVSAAELMFSDKDVGQDAYYAAIEAFHDNSISLVDAGVAGLWIASGKGFKITPLMAPGLTESELRALFEPVLQRLGNLGVQHVFKAEEFPTYLDAYRKMNHPTSTSNIQIGGRLIPRSLVQDGSQSLTQAVRNIHQKGGLVSGFALNVQRNESAHVANSVNSKWRDSVFNLVLGTLWSNTDWEKNLADQKLITDDLLPELDKISPGAAAYLNEGDPNEKNWQEVFYGENYEKLLSIKKKYDPDDLFYGLTAVGSEAWTVAEDGRLCRSQYV